MNRLVLLLCFLLPAVALARETGQHIIGGSNANIANYPYQLSLRTSSHICGASLISATRAVTASHCIGSAASSYSVLAGSSDRTVTTCSTCQLRTCNLARRHPSYNANGFANDIAVLGFSAISTNANVRYITLATPADGTFAGVTCTITGWGRTSSTTNNAPLILQAASTQVITNSACASTFGSSINAGNICIKSPSSTAGACNGDSGGPLVCNGKLAGATSFGVQNCWTSYPSVYSRVSNYNTWILSQ